jgi:hypothetical protein
VRFDQVASECGEDRGLALTALLVPAAEPVPALACILALRLRRIRNHITVLLREYVHSRPARKIVRRLRTAMQHYDERGRASTEARGNEKLVVHRAGLAGKSMIAKLGVAPMESDAVRRTLSGGGRRYVTAGAIGDDAVLAFDGASARPCRFPGVIYGLGAAQPTLNRRSGGVKVTGAH